MRLETDFRRFLLAQPAITNIVSARIYGLLREPQSLLPAVMIQRIHTARSQTFCGVTALVSADMQVDSFAMTGDDAWTLASALRKSLKDFTGQMGATLVDKVFLINEFPMTDPDPGIMRVVQTYNFWYLED